MSILRRGPWRLRFEIIVDREASSLSYLTSNGVDNVVMIEPGNDEPVNLKQIWYAVPVEGKKDYYRILQDPDLTHPPGLTLIKDSDKVILTQEPDEWFLEYVPVHIANGDVYKIHPPPPSKIIIGVYDLLGKEGHLAAIQRFPVHPGNPDPSWQFLLSKI